MDQYWPPQDDEPEPYDLMDEPGLGEPPIYGMFEAGSPFHASVEAALKAFSKFEKNFKRAHLKPSYMYYHNPAPAVDFSSKRKDRS